MHWMTRLAAFFAGTKCCSTTLRFVLDKKFWKALFCVLDLEMSSQGGSKQNASG